MPNIEPKYQADELMPLAIMSKTPVVIVEGIDDVSIYEDIAASIQKLCDVYPVELIDGFAEGSDQVIKALSQIQENSDGLENSENIVMGIIDKDVRDFRGEIPGDLPSLFTLRFYSIESHFVHPETALEIVQHMTNAGARQIRDSVKVIIESRLAENQEAIYYCSVEALRASCQPDYEGDVTYGYTWGRIKDQQLKDKVLAKKSDLDQFASTLGIGIGWEQVRLIAKGKWLIEWFIDIVVSEVHRLKEHCATNTITQCTYCKVGANHKCLYRMCVACNHNQASSILSRQVHVSEVDYIRDRLSALAW